LRIQSNESWCPFDVEFCSESVIRGNSEGYNILINKIGYVVVRIRNCIHLLATNSTRIKEIQEDSSILGRGFGNRVIHIRFPLNLFGHSKPPE
jgi:hypothetical protein